MQISIKAKKLAIACSGGLDSLALAILANEQADITALIVNHNLRPAAKTEAARAAKILVKLGIKNEILEYKGKKPEANLQEEARKIRYKLLLDHCKKHGFKTLATAHHADDNAENFLLRLARGSGVDGLSAMPAETEMEGIKIIRPLLSFTKAELEKFLRSKKIKWVEDATNKTNKYRRNQLRHALEKMEDRELITKRINETSQNFARVREFLEAQTKKAEKATINKNQIDLKKLGKLHDEIAFRVLNSTISKHSPKLKKPRAAEVLALKTYLLNNEKRTLAGLIFSPKNGQALISLEKA